MDATHYMLSGDYKYVALESNYTKVRNHCSVIFCIVCFTANVTLMFEHNPRSKRLKTRFLL